MPGFGFILTIDTVNGSLLVVLAIIAILRFVLSAWPGFSLRVRVVSTEGISTSRWHDAVRLRATSEEDS